MRIPPIEFDYKGNLGRNPSIHSIHQHGAISLEEEIANGGRGRPDSFFVRTLNNWSCKYMEISCIAAFVKQMLLITRRLYTRCKRVFYRQFRFSGQLDGGKIRK